MYINLRSCLRYKCTLFVVTCSIYVIKVHTYILIHSFQWWNDEGSPTWEILRSSKLMHFKHMRWKARTYFISVFTHNLAAGGGR